MSDADRALLTARCTLLYHRYAWAVDEHDLDALRALVTPDVRMTRADGTRTGVEAFLEVYRAFAAEAIPRSTHVISNVVAHRGPSDKIQTHAYFEATMFETERTRIIAGRYDDVHVDQDGTLLLAHKVIRVDRVLYLPAAETAYTNVGAAQDGGDR
jgi:hypothetical protein